MNVLQSLLESLPEPYIILSRDLNCLALNASFAQLIEDSSESVQGSSVAAFWPDVQRVCTFSGEHTVEFHLHGGKKITARLVSRISDVIVVRVLSSVAAGESAQLHHKQRLESLGLLAGGIAHDFNNVLTGIMGHVAYLKHVLASAEMASESLSAIEEGAIRASGLTQQILKFSKLDSAGQSTHIDVIDLMNRVGALLKSAIPAEISLHILESDRGFGVLASEAFITQILINLVINARDAILDGSGKGTIVVSFEPTCSEDEVHRFFGNEPAASTYGAFVVRDDGMGMSDEVKARLFEPYFTTKSASGTGLGLATVHSIVEQLGGAIEVTSHLNKGSAFRIILPLISGDATEQCGASAQTEGLQRGSGERVLVIDDEYAVRNVIGLSLSHLGYNVETAASGLEGVSKFQEAELPYQLVILDLLMPGLSGEEVFNRLRAADSRVPILIVSGFSSEHVVRRILEDGGKDFIQKPFSIEVLSEKVRRCLSD